MGNRNRGYKQNLRTLRVGNAGSQCFLFSCHRFCFYILTVCLIASQVYARRHYYIEEFDPVGLLESRLEQHSQDANTPNKSQSSSQILEIQSVQNERSADSDITATAESSDRITQQTKVSAGNISESWQSSLIDSNEESPKPASSTQNDLLIAQIPITESGRQLWQVRISVPKDTNDAQSKNELQQIIKQISSVEFKTQELAPKPIVVVAPVQNRSPMKFLSDAQTPQSQTSLKTEPKLPYEPITEQTLQIFKNSSEHPEQLNNPFELAEVLFNSGYLPEAAKCYKEALNRMPADEPDRFQDRAWLLFQIGNCLQKADPQNSMEMYRQLITEYPGSPWTDSAKAKSKLIDWYLNDKPRTLINGSKR